MKQVNNFGIVAGITWNILKRENNPSIEDLEHSKFGYVQEHEYGHESINFGRKKYPAEPDGNYIAYTSMFNRFPSLDWIELADLIQIG